MIGGKQTGDANNSCYTNQWIDNSGNDHTKIIEDERDKVEIEKTDKSPIQCSDNNNDECDFL